jgi:hypothetical protein
MTTVGFVFTKIAAEKKTVSDQNIRIENNVGITSVELANIIDPKRSIVKFEFAFYCKYEPSVGIIELKGELVEMFDKELATKIVDSWKKDKKLHPEIMSRVLNTIMSRSNVEAILMSKELQLPPPVQLPKVEVKPRSAEAKSDVKAAAGKQETKAKEEPKKK